MSNTGAHVVVGGGSGIGASVVSILRSSGARVLVWDISGGEISCDVSSPEEVEAAAQKTIELVGAPTALTVTAGIGHSRRLTRAAADDWDRIMNVNARGPWLVMRSLAPSMSSNGCGSIVVTSSVSGRLPDKTMGLYCASKAALNMVVKVAALEWGPEIRVNAVAPGVTYTPMLGGAPPDGAWLSGVARRTALDRLGSADDVAQAILSLHEMKWVTGQVLECDGGLGLCSPIDPTGQIHTTVGQQ